MPDKKRKKIDAILEKYRSKLKNQLGDDGPVLSQNFSTREYNEFKREILPKQLSVYEKLCNFTEKIIKVDPSKDKEASLIESIEICHLNITPIGATSFALFFPLIYMLFGAVFSFLILDSFFFVVFFLFSGIGLMYVLGRLPYFFANNWRLKASNQMVISIFYVVTFMRHTSNLENALDFASQHLTGPLSLDFKKILWDTETEKYFSIKESLDNYLESWRKWNIEYIEAFHLIESSLYEGSEDRRLSLLEKSLSVMLDETFEKMLHYAQNLKTPITTLHMMGVILPVLGLVILPLVVSFMESVRWYHLATLYNIVLPVAVFYMGKNILASRPTGYGDTDISEANPELKKYKNIIINLGLGEIIISPAIISILFVFIFVLIGISPVILHYAGMPEVKIGDFFRLLDYKTDKYGVVTGPFGIGAAVLSLFVPLGLGVGIGLYYKMKSKNIVNIRERTKGLEKEFASALFQLGNRLGDGLPAEIAFEKVADTMKGTTSGDFFMLAVNNIRNLGMSLGKALFDKKIGALVFYPSKVIKSSMKVMIESSRKGPGIASKAVINTSEYLRNMHRVNERLSDMLSEVISSMKSQISFLAPVIAGIVIGITSMVTSILGSLGEQMTQLSSEGGGQVSSMGAMFGNGIPTFYFQIIVGLYIVQLVYILSIMVNGIENGSDKLNEQFVLGKNLIKATSLYVTIALVVMVLFNMIAAQIMGPINLGI